MTELRKKWHHLSAVGCDRMMRRSLHSNASIVGVLSLILGFGALAWLVRRLVVLAGRPFDFSNAPFSFGTPGAPYSDALGPWVWGGICYLFRFTIPEFIYRPSVGLFWGSIMGITGRIYTIPLWFALWFLSGVVALLWFTRGSRIGLVIALWLCTANLVFEGGLTGLNIMTDAVDFPAWVFTVLGTLFVLYEFSGERIELLGLAAGSILLGIAAAIRGPMMFGAPVMLAAGFFGRRRWSIAALIVAVVAFGAPIAVDVGLQKYHHTVNNGVASLYCAYADPTGSWTPECNARYLSERPSTKEVLVTYMHTVVTLKRAPELFRRGAERIETDIRRLVSGEFFVIGLAALLSGLLIMIRGPEIESGGGESRSRRKTHALMTPLLTFLLISVADIAVSATSGAVEEGFVVGLVFSLALLSAFRRRWIEFGLIAAYIASVFFMVITGVWAHARISETFAFLVYLSTILLLIPRFPSLLTPSLRSLRIPALATLTIIVTMYTAVLWWPATLPRTFARDVKSRSAAMKLSEDAALNRSLYINGDRDMFYTLSDNVPIGSVRPYQVLRYPGLLWNDSFLKPNEFQ